MNGKKKLYGELAYLIGIVVLAIGTAFMERADFGMSMVVAPAYILYLKLSQIVGWFTFGMAEYCFQAVLIVLITVIMRKFKVMYLFSFCTAVFYGLVLDCCIALIAPLTCSSFAARVAFYLIGMVTCSVGVAFLFHTYIAPEAYELIVKEIAIRFHRDISRVKTVYDCTSCLLAVVLSFVFFGIGHFEGVKLGTVLCALINGWLIGKVSGILEKHFVFCDALKK